MNTPNQIARTRYPVKVAAQNGQPAVDAEFSRITVILGANGTGKSRLLSAFLQDEFVVPGETGRARRKVMVEGHRKAQPPVPLAKGSPSAMTGSFRSLDSRLNHIFNVLARPPKDDETFASECDEWFASSQRGPRPERGERRIDHCIANVVTMQMKPSLMCKTSSTPTRPT
jgi:hypothetical protein